MALELVYTSATRGLRAGTSGFCTVAMTRGLPAALVPRLEALGGYRPGPSGDGPTARCFWRVETATGIAHVLAVVGPAPPDHTARSNKIAAYLVLSPDELTAAGPAWLLAQEGLLRKAWSGAPAWIEEPAKIPSGPPLGPAPCAAWQAAAGDAGWAGVLASAFLRDQSKPAHVIYRAGTDPLALVAEAMRLLPDWARWRATFSTYFLQPVAGTPCAWRFCLEGTPAADAARQSKGMVIDLVRGPGTPVDSRFVRMARTGIDEEPAPARSSGRAGSDRVSRREIELAPDTDAGRAEPPVRPLPWLAPSTDTPAPATGAAPMRPAAVALVAAGCTVLLLLVLLVVVMSRSEPAAAPAAAQAEPSPRAALPARSAVADEPPPVAEPAPTPEPAPAPAPAPAPEPAPEPAPAEEPPAPAPSSPAAEQEPATPAPPPAPLPAPTDDLPPAVAAPAAAPAVPPPPVSVIDPTLPRWVMKLTPEDGAVALRGSAELSSSAVRSLRFRAPPLPGASVDAGSPSTIRFGADGFRAAARMEGTTARLDGFASGAVPASLEQGATPGQAPGAALRRALERCVAEAVDASGRVVGVVQFRAPIGVAIVVGADRSLPVPDAGDGPVEVQAVPPKGEPMPPAVRVAPSESRTVVLGAGVLLTVDRSVQRSASVVRASMPSSAEIAARRTALVAEIDALAARIADGSVPADDRASAAARLDAARRELVQLTDAGRSRSAPPRWSVRITSPDGVVLLDAPVTMPSAPGGRR